MNEQKLIQACKKNVYAAQMQVYHLYKDMLYNSCLRILKNKEDAEDAVQESFIKGFQRMHQMKEEKYLGAWLKRIAINHCLDVVRKQKNTIWLEETLVLESVENEIEDENELLFSVEKIKECIYQLKDKYRIVLVLYLIENYTHKEISSLLQLNESTVRNQYSRGKNKLLQLLKNN